MPNITMKFYRPSGTKGCFSSDDFLAVDLFSTNTKIIMAKIKYECNEKEDRYEYKLFIDGDLVREIWHWKKDKTYDVILDLIGG